MATQYVMTPAVPNRSLSAKLYTTAMVEQATASSITETVSNSGIYEVVFTEASALAGDFRIVITDILTGYGVASYEAYFIGTDGERINASEYHAVGSADEKLNQILAKITPLTTVYTAQPDSSSLYLVRGDNYDGVSWPKLVFDSSKDLSAVTDINFTIRDTDDNIVISTADTGVTAEVVGTTVEVTLLNSSSSLLPIGYSHFDCEVIFTDSHQTIANGCVDTTQDISR